MQSKLFKNDGINIVYLDLNRKLCQMRQERRECGDFLLGCQTSEMTEKRKIIGFLDKFFAKLKLKNEFQLFFSLIFGQSLHLKSALQ